MDELSEKHWKRGRAIQYLNRDWDSTNRKVTFNRGRVIMKRYLAVMANVKLRKRYFSF